MTARSAVTVTMLSAVAVCASGCGKSAQRSTPARPPTRQATLSTPRGPAFGLTENNPNLLWNPRAAHRTPVAFHVAQSELSALAPTYLRVLIDWAALQPKSDEPAQLAQPGSGCARQIAPCGAYEGIREELEAIASQQRAGSGFQVVLDIFGVPEWAARAPSGCEKPGTRPFSRPLNTTALADYRALIHSLLELASQQGVKLDWWSPWNEPNDPYFISPQRSGCATGVQSLAPAVYAELADAMEQELHANGGEHHLLLGELGGYLSGSPDRTSISEFIAALPASVICMSEEWSVHAYASPRRGALAQEPVGALERALDARGSCGRSAQIWVTETGAGSAASHPQPESPAAPRSNSLDQSEECRALAEQLIRWYGDPRVKAVFQYTFREDPDFPVGLISADLSHLYPTYQLWLAWSRALAAGRPAPPLPAQCA